MKKLLSVLLCTALVVGVFGCYAASGEDATTFQVVAKIAELASENGLTPFLIGVNETGQEFEQGVLTRGEGLEQEEQKKELSDIEKIICDNVRAINQTLRVYSMGYAIGDDTHLAEALSDRIEKVRDRILKIIEVEGKGINDEVLELLQEICDSKEVIYALRTLGTEESRQKQDVIQRIEHLQGILDSYINLE